MCNVPVTQAREREIRKKNLQTITSAHGFHLHGLNRQISPSYKSWTPLCPDSCLYAYRIHMVCTPEDKDSRRSCKSIYGPHLQQFRRKHQNSNRQLNRIQEQTLQRSCCKTRYEIFNSFTSIQATK